MDIKRIVVDELPECCSSCQFHIVLDYVGRDWCTAAKKTILEKITYKLISPSWCPLQVEEECRWKVETEGSIYDSITDRDEDYRCLNCNYIVSTADFEDVLGGKHHVKFCPNCGKRIRYEEE